MHKSPKFTPPPAAHPLPRTLAFLMDFTIVFLIGLWVIGQYFLPQYWREESLKFQHYLTEHLSSLSPSSIRTLLSDLAALPEIRPMLVQIDQIFFLITWLYFALSEIVLSGSSLGKRIFYLRVLRCDGSPLTLIEIILYNTFKVIALYSFWPLIPILNLLPIFWTPLRRSVCDRVCNAYVAIWIKEDVTLPESREF
ncbi:MAG: RDD family protein [Puniceicoccales bacterium]|nr:RDD family protein [Puniceicoccales bacterium]